MTLQPALDLGEELGIQELCTLGLTRAYTTRHGAGPLPTFAPELDALLNDPGNPRNPWQGGIRFGWLDLMLLRYAADAAGGPLDGIVVNGLDQLYDDRIKLCTSYQTPDQTRLCELPVAPIPCLSAQEKLTAFLENVIPVYEQVTADVLCQRLASELAPLAISGSGRTWQERAVHQLRFRPFSNAGTDVACNQLEKFPC